MPRTKAKLIALLPATLVCLLLLTPASAKVQRHARHKPPVKKQEPAPQPVLPPPPPPPPLTLEQMPAIPPQVTFQNGLLTIVAPNSTLGDILRAVRSRTGASVEIPANATERVVSHLGPAPARDVLASLLNGSLFNYVMLGSESDASALERVILTPRPGGAGQANATNPAQQVYVAPQVQMSPPPQAVQVTQDNADEGQEDNAGELPDAQPENQEQVQPQAEPAQQPNVKTPEQLLQELQRQQQLQQQQQQLQQGQPQPQPIYPPNPQPPQNLPN